MRSDDDLTSGAVSVQYRRRIGSGGIVDATVGHSWFRNWAYELAYCSRRWDLPPTYDTADIDDEGMRQTSAEVRATWWSRRATMVAAVQASGFAGSRRSRATPSSQPGWAVLSEPFGCAWTRYLRDLDHLRLI